LDATVPFCEQSINALTPSPAADGTLPVFIELGVGVHQRKRQQYASKIESSDSCTSAA